MRPGLSNAWSTSCRNGITGLPGLTSNAHTLSQAVLTLVAHLGEDCSGEEASCIACQVQDASEWRKLPAVASSGVQHDLREATAQSNDGNGGRLKSCTSMAALSACVAGRHIPETHSLTSRMC